MVSYRQNEGIDTFLVIESEMIYTDSYELAMLRNNDIKGIIRPDIRVIDGRMLEYIRINGMLSFREWCIDREIDAREIFNLLDKMCNVVMECGDYMLSPDNLLLELNNIFVADQRDIYFIYSFGHEKCIKEQIRDLVSDLLKIVDHKATDLLDDMYNIYELVSAENFDIKKLCDDVKRIIHKSSEKNDDRIIRSQRNQMVLDEVFGETIEPEKTVEVVEGTAAKKKIRMSVLVLAALCVTLTVITVMLMAGYVVKTIVIDDRWVMAAVAALAVEIFVWIEYRKKELEEDGRLDDITVNSVERSVQQQECHTDILNDTAGITSVLAMTENIEAEKDLLVQFIGQDGTNTLNLTDRDKIIGRDKCTVDMLVVDRNVSRNHLLVHGENEEIYIEDMDSTNGTYVNGMKLPQRRKWKIKSGDVVRIGNCEYVVQFE